MFLWVCVIVLLLSCGYLDFQIISLIILSTERSPPIEEVIQAGVVPRFVQFLVRDDFPQLQVFATLLSYF